MADGSPRKPDYNLVVKAKAPDSTRNQGPGRSNRIGVAWEDERGYISIQLSTGVRISWDDPVYLSLFPTDAPEKEDR